MSQHSCPGLWAPGCRCGQKGRWVREEGPGGPASSLLQVLESAARAVNAREPWAHPGELGERPCLRGSQSAGGGVAPPQWEPHVIGRKTRTLENLGRHHTPAGAPAPSSAESLWCRAGGGGDGLPGEGAPPSCPRSRVRPQPPPGTRALETLVLYGGRCWLQKFCECKFLCWPRPRAGGGPESAFLSVWPRPRQAGHAPPGGPASGKVPATPPCLGAGPGWGPATQPTSRAGPDARGRRYDSHSAPGRSPSPPGPASPLAAPQQASPYRWRTEGQRDFPAAHSQRASPGAWLLAPSVLPPTQVPSLSSRIPLGLGAEMLNRHPDGNELFILSRFRQRVGHHSRLSGSRQAGGWEHFVF